MKTILLPVDSSETSKHTLAYIKSLLSQISPKKIILLQSCESSFFDNTEERAMAEVELQRHVTELQNTAGEKCIVKYVISNFSLIRAIHQTISQVDIDLLVLGSDSFEEESPIGDEIITISKSSPVPVLIVPSGCHYQKISNALVPCNFNDITNLNLMGGIDEFESLHLKLLNVEADELAADKKSQTEKLISTILNKYRHSFHYTLQENIVDGILEYSTDFSNNIQLVIALPGRRSFFYRLTHSSITQALTQNSSIPVLLLKEDS